MDNPKRVAIGRHHQPTIIDRFKGGWRVWISYNPTVTAGSYYEFYNSGRVELYITNANMIEEIIHVRSADQDKELYSPDSSG
jgi:ribosomal protein L21E